jgi:hypothetical protein
MARGDFSTNDNEAGGHGSLGKKGSFSTFRIDQPLERNPFFATPNARTEARSDQLTKPNAPRKGEIPQQNVRAFVEDAPL